MARTYVIQEAADGRFSFNLRAENGEIILTSKLYEREDLAERDIERVRRHSREDESYERKESSNGQPFFVLKAEKHTIGRSQLYSSESARDKGIASVKSNAPDADLVPVQADQAEFKEVLADELKHLGELRSTGTAATSGPVYQRAREADLAGLAFSGGGIRSATFNLGVIQALSKYELLSRFDYLSAVSGGGYIGGWLSALLHRQAGNGATVTEQDVKEFQTHLKTHPDEAGSQDLHTVGFPPVEHIAVRYLRRYSSYLSPRLGLSGDMLAGVSICLRNFVLIQLSLISLVAGVLLLAHVLVEGSEILSTASWLGPTLFFCAVIALALAIFSSGRLMAERPGKGKGAVGGQVILPATLAAWLFSVSMISRGNADFVDFDWPLWVSLVLAGIGYAGSWALGFVPEHLKNEGASRASGVSLLVAATFAGAVFGLLLLEGIRRPSSDPIDSWHLVAFGTPLFLAGLSLVGALHMGAARRRFEEHEREWLARLGGLALVVAIAWGLLFSIVLYATPFVHWLGDGGTVALAAWAGGSGLGAWFARAPSTDGTPSGSAWRERVTRVAPLLFLAGVAVGVAYLTQVGLLSAASYQWPDGNGFGSDAGYHLEKLNELYFPTTLYAFLGAVVLFVAVSGRLDINLFSLHALYCNRLARAYLGASRAGERGGSPFTGFDPKDDLPFHELAKQRPIPIINTAINMTGGDDLAWQTRRAASFAFTPRWAGFETRSSQGEELGKYRPTRKYAGGRNLGTLMAVSGAAVSPNMGYHTSASVAALLTAFNLRLGRWCGNPAKDGGFWARTGRWLRATGGWEWASARSIWECADHSLDKNRTWKRVHRWLAAKPIWQQVSPWFVAKPILAELTGSANAQADWINLSDGGHFDNLGLYELVRRRCRLIVVTDVGCDPKYQFEDLANTLRKCWTDLGVNIRFEEFDAMRKKSDGRERAAHGIVGRIEYDRYDEGDQDYEGDKKRKHGVVIYLKASMTGDEWPDILNYARSHEDFPHETTADQFFDENQFEAYRHLGFKVAAKMIGDLEAKLKEQVAESDTSVIVSGLLRGFPKPQ